MESLRKDIKEIRESQIRMESDIKYHIKRTDLLEEEVERRAAVLEQEVSHIDDEVKKLGSPISAKDVLKIAGVIVATISSILVTLKTLNLI